MNTTRTYEGQDGTVYTHTDGGTESHPLKGASYCRTSATSKTVWKILFIYTVEGSDGYIRHYVGKVKPESKSTRTCHMNAEKFVPASL